MIRKMILLGAVVSALALAAAQAPVSATDA